MTDLITLDFETYYDRVFSLSKMTTEEYIRHKDFETIGIAIKVNEGESEWFSGTKAQTKRWLDKYDWDNSVAIAHNAVFDMAILNWHFDIRPKRIADTLSMLRAIDGPDAGNNLAKAAERYELGTKGDEVINALGKRRIDFSVAELGRYGEYCINDVELTYKLFTALMPLLPPLEMRLIDLTVRMFTEPVLILNKSILTTHLAKVKEKKEQLMNAISADRTELVSNPKLAQLLTKMGVTPPQKTSLATGRLTWAFGKSDEGFKALLEHPNLEVQAVVAARMGVKSTLEETRTERFIKIAERGTLPVPLRYYAAHTGRWGGDDKINLQNVPRKSLLKKAMEAPEGYTFIDCDSSQIEARVLAWLAGQDDLVEAFDRGEDVYKIMASAIYNISVEEVTDAQRFVGKVVVLACGYGLGPEKFQAQLKSFGVDMMLDECTHIIRTYRDTYPQITALWKQATAVLDALTRQTTAPLGLEGVLSVDLFGIRLPNGMYIRYPNLRSEKNAATGYTEFSYDTKKGRSTIPTRIYGGKMVENVCQALARIIIGEQMLMIARRYRVVMTVHDAVGSLAKDAEAGVARKFVEACMRTRPKWAVGLPLNCESKEGKSYGG